ncbi:MTOR-associated protein MEAK7 [Strongylocentrotus purpuratus]|uniref:MTOR-associated protein MEAK7 n=1 Tax=Strongylocentrotus purpuratus TaxID=7668 RepID=A0A7M7HKL6_STRPU|nr:MTOR-associated protein MEAK7 [Strongylocentrotus purpuratus]|eukprot:XP_011668260.1 PREDICTED: TLD domain-containing protein 1 [Strongylocentrotus purpuratus]
MRQVQGVISSITSISQEAFIITLAKLLKGTMEETSLMVCGLAANMAERLTKEELSQFIADILSSYEKALKAADKMGGWKIGADADSKHRFVQFTLQGMDEAEGEYLSVDQVQSWLEKTRVFYSLFTDVFQVCFHPGNTMLKDDGAASAAAYVDEADTITDDIIHHVPTLPLCKDAPWSKFTTLLDLPSLLTINYHLPHELRREWRFLYSSSIHGSSFSTFLAHIQNKGPTVLVVRDTDGKVFGGFGSESWHLGPNFIGNTHCFLFSLTSDLGVYETTAHNDHYMYLNIDQQTMPNGLGMGGQFDYFGLWLDQDYGKGHSRAKPKCTTYDSPQLSGSENFVIDCVEVWAVGPLPKKDTEDDEEGGHKSILDKDAAATALLELIGKARKSEGLREIDEDAMADIPEVHELHVPHPVS